MATNSEIEKLERRWQENPLGLTFAPLAEAYRKSGEVAKALELLDVGLTQHPNYVPAHIVRGRCYVDSQQGEQAEQAFRRVTELDPENAIALKGLADLAESAGRVSEAIARLETMLEVDRDNEDARGQLDRLRELPPPVAAESDRVEVLDHLELSSGPAGDFQLPDDGVALRPSEESYPDIVLQAAELEKSLPKPEDAQGSDLIEEPDPAAAVGTRSLDDDPALAAFTEADFAAVVDAGDATEFIADVETAPLPDLAIEPPLEATPVPVAETTEAAFSWEAAAAPPPMPEAESAVESESEPPAAEAAEPEWIAPGAAEPEWVAPESGEREWFASQAGTTESVAHAAEPESESEPAPFAEAAVEPEPVAAAEPEPELVVTETMAEIFLRQGHRELALAVYSQLAQRDPANSRVADAFARLAAELAPPAAPEPPPAPAEQPRRYAAAATGGRSVADRFAGLLSAIRPVVAPPVHPPTFEASRRPVGEATRPAPDSLSLSAVFGEEAAPAGPAGGALAPAPAEPSFEQFFAPPEATSADAELPRTPESGAPAMSSMAPEDLEQFNAWLRGLKR